MPLIERVRPELLYARRLYDGVGDRPNFEQIIEIVDGRIAAIRPATVADARDGSLPEFNLVAPGFIDLQINGAGDTQFNFDPRGPEDGDSEPCARALGLEGAVGSVCPGLRASFTCLTSDLEVAAVMVDGQFPDLARA